MKQNKRTAGFTLVELIVVIAIMGILGGVGSLGYSGYVKSSNKNIDKTTIQEVYRAIDTAGKTYAYDVSDVGQASDNGLQIPIGFIMLTNGEKTDGSTGDYVKVMSTTDTIGIANKAMLENILADTFGSSYSTDLKLLSDIWTESTIPGMFAEADNLYDSMETLTNALALGTRIPLVRDVIESKFPNMANYKDASGNVVGEKVVVGMAEGVASISQDEFLNIWMNVDGNGGINCAFGLASKGVETYTAARRAYNEGFASYIESRTDVAHDKTTTTTSGSFWSPTYSISTTEGAGSASDHAKQVKKHGSALTDDLVVSDAICTSAFSNDPINGDSKLDNDVQHCQHCANLYTEYKSSEQCRQNGIAFYQAMVTIVDTQDAANANADGFWDYYETYIGNFSNLYSTVDTEQSSYKSAVVLTVYYRNDILVSEVSPNNYLDA